MTKKEQNPTATAEENQETSMQAPPDDQNPETNVQADEEEENTLDETDDTSDAWEKIKGQPTVKIMIPSEQKYWEGFLNGHPIMIKTNEYVDVPRDIAKLIENNQRVLRDSEEKLKTFNSRTGMKVAEIG